jgi:ribosomal protein L30E
MSVLSSSHPITLRTMYRQLMALLAVTVVATIPTSTFASGSVPTTRASSRDSLGRVNLNTARPSTTSDSKVLIAEQPYNLGKALFSGKYKFGRPKLTASNVAEKKQRLVTLQSVLPAQERKKINPTELASQLTDREANALEYYIGVRFGKSITKPPSWAKEEPPPKIASSR